MLDVTFYIGPISDVSDTSDTCHIYAALDRTCSLYPALLQNVRAEITFVTLALFRCVVFQFPLVLNWAGSFSLSKDENRGLNRRLSK